MAETSGERAKRLKAARQRRWRLRRELDGVAPAAGAVLAVPPGPGAGDGLPVHMSAPMFGVLRELGLESVEEARRYSEHVRRMDPETALTPVKAGSAAPAAEARHQRESALRFLTASAATPVTAARVLRDVAGAFDVAGEIQAFQEGRPSRITTSYIAADGRLVAGELVTGRGRVPDGVEPLG